jgi:hypothetical protein
MEIFKNCFNCGEALWNPKESKTFECRTYCKKCWEKGKPNGMPTIPLIKEFNEPPHYHKHEIDTIDFLQKGFPPEVFKGFAIGSIVKYLHRHTEKNGLEDLLKAEDYAKRLFQFAKEIDKRS